MDKLTEIGVQSTLRYAVQLLTPSYETAKAEGRDEVSVKDVDRALSLFSDVKRSVEELNKWKEKFMY